MSARTKYHVLLVEQKHRWVEAYGVTGEDAMDEATDDNPAATAICAKTPEQFYAEEPAAMRKAHEEGE